MDVSQQETYKKYHPLTLDYFSLYDFTPLIKEENTLQHFFFTKP